MERRTFLALPLGFSFQQSANLNQLPPNLPRPVDDGGARHLTGMMLPDIALPSTASREINISKRRGRRVVLYCYPMTGRPDRQLPQGWDDIPGARGCTPETCGFRDHHAELKKLQSDVYGLSVQDSPYQREMVDRLHVPFEMLSDEHFRFTDAMRLPTFAVEGLRLIKRLTMIVRDGRVEHVFYPVFPPDTHADEVIAWLKANPRR